MKKMTWASSVLAILVLTACGSGGSGSGVNNTGTTPSTPVVTTTNPSFQGVKADGTGTAGVAVVDAMGKYTYTYNGTVVDVTGTNLSSSTVANVIIGSLNQMQAIGGTQYSYMRFGGIAPKDQARKGDVFYVGKQTVNMPTTGIAVYKGLGVGSDGSSYFSFEPLSFNVDFGAKTISGKADAYTEFVFQTGKISGSQFSGNVSPTIGGGTYSGSFFGPAAEELGGIAKINATEDDPAINISFGAKKQ